MKMRLCLFLVCAALAGSFATGFAAEKTKAVMMPVTGGVSLKHKMLVATKVAAVLGKTYQVQWGGSVNREVSRIFSEESGSLDCDLEPCYRKVAALYKVDEVIGVIVLGSMGGEVSVTVRGVNVMENRETFSTVIACPECNEQKLTSVLERLSITSKNNR